MKNNKKIAYKKILIISVIIVIALGISYGMNDSGWEDSITIELNTNITDWKSQMPIEYVASTTPSALEVSVEKGGE